MGRASSSLASRSCTWSAVPGSSSSAQNLWTTARPCKTCSCCRQPFYWTSKTISWPCKNSSMRSTRLTLHAAKANPRLWTWTMIRSRGLYDSWTKLFLSQRSWLGLLAARTFLNVKSSTTPISIRRFWRLKTNGRSENLSHNCHIKKQFRFFPKSRIHSTKPP